MRQRWWSNCTWQNEWVELPFRQAAKKRLTLIHALSARAIISACSLSSGTFFYTLLQCKNTGGPGTFSGHVAPYSDHQPVIETNTLRRQAGGTVDISTLSAKKYLKQLFLMLSKSSFKMNVLGPVNVVVNKLLFAKVRSGTLEVEDNTLLNHSIGRQLHHEQGKFPLVRNFSYHRTNGMSIKYASILVVGSCFDLKNYFSQTNQRRPSLSSRCQLAKQMSLESALFQTDSHDKRLFSRHYYRPARINSWNMEPKCSSKLYEGGYRSSPPVAPNGVTGVLVDKLSVETSLGRPETSTRSRSQFSLVYKAYLTHCTTTNMKKEQQNQGSWTKTRTG